MHRREDWPERLFHALARAENRPFEWGVHDCALFAATCIEAMTDEDPMGGFRGAYHDAESAAAAIRNAGHRSLYHLLAHLFGQPVPRVKAGRGDLLLAHGDDGPALGILDGHHGCFVGEAQLAGRPVNTGLVRVPLSDIRHFFKVG